MVQIRGDLVWASPGLKVYFDLDTAGIARYALQSGELGTAVRQLADSAKRYAISVSPYDPDGDPPHYRDSWETVPYIERRVGGPPMGPMPRQAYLLTNNSPQAMVVEFGNGRTDPIYGHRIFAKVINFLDPTAGERVDVYDFGDDDYHLDGDFS